MNPENSENTPVKSTAVVKYSASQSPALFAQLQCNTDLNLPPANWLSSSASAYGLQHVLSHSTGFSSFRMAHMFPDCVGEVDVVSDAENIKNLLKLPYSRGQVSMIVHRIENTLLIDEFDIYKHLLRRQETEWEWLRKYFFEEIRSKYSDTERNKYLQNKSRNVLQQKSLVSKFLYHSLVEGNDKNDPSTSQNEKPETFSISGPALPDPNMEEEVPDPTSNHKYNRNVVWTFEDLQMLLGTDMPIFGGSTHPCISLRLRDMSSPISVLTGIDYWLDNLMSNVPEVVMCYHLNGIVQKYELIKTEDLPNLGDSKFSPSVIRDIAQNILSFLKSNATKAGHTYWLFKSKDDDVVKLYDLSSLYARRQGDEDDQNPFTVPVAMLLYRVARNMKHTSGRKQPGTIRMLLKNCIQLLPKEKYPQIVTSSHYMISDLYVPAHTDPASPGLEQMETDDMDSCYEDDLSDNDSSDVATMQLSLGYDPTYNNFVYKPPPPISGTLDERCQHALNNVLSGLECLQYFPSHDENAEELKQKVEQARKREEEDNPTMAKPFQAIPMPYSKLGEDKQYQSKAEKRSAKKKNKASAPNKNETLCESLNTLLLKPISEAIPTWQEPERTDNASWNAHLKTLLYEKACLVFAILAEQDYVLENYGSTLQSIEMLIRCHQVLHSLKYSSRAVQESCFLGRAGDACFMIVKNWHRLATFKEQLAKVPEICTKIIEQIDKEELTKESDKIGVTWEGVLHQAFESIEKMLLASCTWYEKALVAVPVQEINTLYRRLGNAQNELGVLYTTRASEHHELFQDSYNKALFYLQSGLKSFETVRDEANLALLHSNVGRLMRLCAHYYSRGVANHHNCKGQEKHFYNKALDSYQKALQVLGSRRHNPIIWDTVSWELSSALFTRASLLQDYPVGGQDEDRAEREVVETLQKALRYCDMESPGPRQVECQCRVGAIHQRLASLYHSKYRRITSQQQQPHHTQPQHTQQHRKHLLQLAKLHYERACNLFRATQQHCDLLKALLERVALSEFLAKNGSSVPYKIKQLQYCLHLLLESVPSLNWVLDKGLANKILSNTAKSTNNNKPSTVDEEHDFAEKASDEAISNFESQAMTFVNTVEQQLQYSLRMLAKLCLTRSVINKDCDISELYKTLYSLTLKVTRENDWIVLLEQLLIILYKIKNSCTPLTAPDL